MDGDSDNRSELLGEIALDYHEKSRGKLQVLPKCPIRDYYDFAYWYTPGVAKASLEIHGNKERSYDLTNRGNLVAIVTDGTRVLGLGNIGPEAAMPVMEGKALLFKYLGGVDAFPLCLKTRDPRQMISAVELIEPSFGGINFEDIETPKCFHVLENTRHRLGIPVWHDDQQGTATIILAGLINALKIVGKEIGNVQISLIGAGAANIRTAMILIKYGAKAENIFIVDSGGILNQGRDDLEDAYKRDADSGKWKWELCLITNKEGREGGIAEAMKDTDICIAASKQGPGTIKKEWVKRMTDDSILFACANPTPEIWPFEAKQAGARIVATGRSDFPNQINNSLVFPGIFRGALDVRAKTITDEMCIDTAKEIASFAEGRGMDDENIVPKMDEWMVFVKEAVACALKAMEQGVAKINVSRRELEEQAISTIKSSRESIELLMKERKLATLDRYIIDQGRKIRLIY